MCDRARPYAVHITLLLPDEVRVLGACPPYLYLLIPWHFHEDGGRYQSASIIVAQYSGVRNLSIHRQLLRDGNHTVARLVPRHLRTISTEAAEAGDDVPIAVVNGPDPTVLLAAAMSFSDYVDELTVASSLHMRLHGSPLKVVILPNGVMVPADAELSLIHI